MSELGGARPHCQRVFKSLGLLRRHHRVMHGPNTQTCAHCGKFFFGRVSWAIHLGRVHGVVPGGQGGDGSGEVEGEGIVLREEEEAEVDVKKEEEEEVKMEDIEMAGEEAGKEEEAEEECVKVKKEEEEEGLKMEDVAMEGGVKKEEEEDVKMEVEEAVKKEEEEECVKVEEDVKMEVEEHDIKEEEMELEEGEILEDELEDGEIREDMDLDAEALIQTEDDAAPPCQFYHPVYGFYRPMCSEEMFDKMEGKDIQPAWP
ncbi:hypothetical protein BP00DRAFT_455566 [Aspergillus indologenus CBS 114.80]|uniref:C2H2-type domain-containing protein n=1 Tax=Aspergillus indologenus CBS 114.80 TaxID=1450541 RepID=A0A2V5I9L7_9EURO|nr:hypothetical protein BP00DRAFT_455566 [Aspergillus indologenus CBS 114.80]